MIRRIHNDTAGILNDMSDVLATEAWKDPTLFPDLSSEKEILVFSDYSFARSGYKTYSFMIVGRTSVDDFNQRRINFRRLSSLESRRFSFKNLSDRIKLRALPEFLSLADQMKGILITFAVNTEIRTIFAKTFADAWPDLLVINTSVLEEMLRIASFGALSLLTSSQPQQTITWITDDDNIVANDLHQRYFGGLAKASLRQMTLGECGSSMRFGLASGDNGSLDWEDLGRLCTSSATTA